MTHIRLTNIADLENPAVLFDQYRQFYEQTSNITPAKNFIAERLNNHESIIFVAEN